MLQEFKEFAMRGNVMDMAIGIVLGGAFGKIVASFVNDMLMPALGLAMGGVDFSKLFVSLGAEQFETLEAAQAASAAVLTWGNFVQTVVDFLIIAFAIFLVVKGMNSAQRAEQAAPEEPTTKTCPRCISEVPLEATRCAHCTTDI